MTAFRYYGEDGDSGWYVAYSVLVGVILLAVMPFTFLSLMKANFGRDPSRRFVPWLRASFCLFSITLTLIFAQFVIATCIAYNTDIERGTIRAAYHLGYLAELFRTVSAATVMVFLLLLGPGMHHAIRGVSSFFDRILRYSAYFLAFVIVVLAITYYGLLIDLHVNFSNRAGSFDQYGRGPARIRDVNNLIAATAIILFVASLVITGLSIYTFMRRKSSPLRRASTLYLAASLLNLISSTWNFAYAINWLLMGDVMRHYVLILTIILAWWPRGLLLIIAYFVAVRSGPDGGVWSTTTKGGSMMHDSTHRDSYATGTTANSRV